MKQTILIIDDQQSIRLLLTEILKRDYSIVVADDGFQAMLWLSEGNRPDLILTDIHMPNFDGLTLIENLKNSTKMGNIPIIVLSGNDEEEFKEKILRSGVFDFVHKPFDPIFLKNLVKNALKPITLF